MGIFGGDATREDYLRLEARVRALEETVARLSDVRRSAAPAPPVRPGLPAAGLVADSAGGATLPWLIEARTLVAQRKKIQAVKVVKEATRWSLKDAKDYVDRL